MASEVGSSSHTAVAVSLPARIVVGVAALIAFGLGFIGLQQQVPRLNATTQSHFGNSIADLAYYDLQLFVLDSDPVAAGGAMPWELQVARFLAPTAAAYLIFLTAHAVLARQLEQVRARAAHGHTVVYGDGPAVTTIVRQVLAERRKVVLVQSEASASPSPVRNVWRVAGDGRDPAVLRRAGLQRAKEVFAVSTDSAANAQVAVAALGLLRLARRGGTPVACHVQIDDRALCTALIAQELTVADETRLRLELFNPHDRAARRMLGQHPPSATPSIVVVGRGQLAGAVVAELARWRLDQEDTGRTPLDVRVLDPNGPVTDSLASPTNVYVCLDNDADGLNIGFDILRALRGAHRPVPRIVVAVSRWAVFGQALTTSGPAGSASILGPAGLSTFDVTAEIYDMEDLRLGTIERLAREIHAAYLAVCEHRGDTPASNPSMRPWAELPDQLREANREQAADIGPKMRAINCVVAPVTEGAEPFAFDKAEVELLAEREHGRWMESKERAGWRFGGDQRDDARKLTPDLVEWARLSERSRDLDRNAVATIPDVLAAVGLQVVRLGPSETSATGEPGQGATQPVHPVTRSGG